MKIALLSDYPIDQYEKLGRERYWTTPQGIYNSFRKQLPKSEIRWYPMPGGNKLYGVMRLMEQQKSGEFVPDLVFLMNAGPLEDGFWKRENFPHSLMVYEAGDEPQTHHWNKVKAENSDLILTPDKRCYEWYKQNLFGPECIYTAHWASTEIYYPNKWIHEYEPLDTDVLALAKRDIRQPFDVVTTCGDRGEITTFLQNELQHSFYNKTGMKDIENGDFYRRGKIVFQKSRYDEVTRRVFEGMACGAMVITDRISAAAGLTDLFIEDKEIVLYSTKEEALEKIRYYLAMPKEREQIAWAGCTKTLNYHTSDAIVKKIIKFAEKNNVT